VFAKYFIAADYRGDLEFGFSRENSEVRPAPLTCKIFLAAERSRQRLDPPKITVEIDTQKLDTSWAWDVLNFCKKILEPVEMQALSTSQTS
jgi:hypothetical protein